MRRKEINEFNAQFTGYADKQISVQTFAQIYNLIEDWNNTNETDKITLEYGKGGGAISSLNGKNLDNYLTAKPTMETFLSEFFGDKNPNDYYFKFNSPEIRYDDYGRLNYLKMYMYEKT